MLRVAAFAQAALGDEIVNAALAVLVAGIPVLHRGVFDFRVVERDEFHDRRVQLVFIAHRRGAAFEIAHLRAFVGDDERALELAGLRGVDAEIGRKLHRTAHALGDVAERAVGEDGGIQRGKKIVRVRHDRAEIFFHQVGMLLHRLAERAENDALFRELLRDTSCRRRRNQTPRPPPRRRAARVPSAECRAFRKSPAVSGSTSSRLFGPSVFCFGAE